MNETRMTLGRDYNGQNPVGWLASEKLDGIRAYWDGATLWTRQGNAIPAPEAFLAALPPVALDGELWAGRGRFTEARLAAQYGRWTPKVRFAAFDAPQAPGNWSQRMNAARRALKGCRVAFAVEFWPLKSRAHLRREFRRVVNAGGEGLVLRHPTTNCYVIGRTDTLVKVKTDPA